VTETANILIIGAGVAGLVTALALAPRRVTLVTARPLGEGASSVWAQGGLAAALGPDDSPALHFADTVGAGAGLVDAEAARLMVEAGPQAVETLARFGVAFDRHTGGSYKLGREAAHRRDRIVHARGDQAGAAIMARLTLLAREAAHITLLERIIVEDLLKDGSGRIVGAFGYDIARAERVALPAAASVLATGGLGGLYAVTTNPPSAQGHGLGIAARAGAVICDPEFVQFHPTALDLQRDPAPLATEALRGAGARLVNASGRRFMRDYHPAEDLAPRDIVARAVEAERAAGRGAFLDARAAVGAAFPERFPTVFAACMDAGLDPREAPMPIAPAAHYHMGGVMTDLDGRASLEGLWAVGEVASTGVHGANRLASNSLLEAVVFGARIAEALREDHLKAPAPGAAPADRLALAPRPAPAASLARLRAAMSAGAALLRSEASLSKTLDAIAELSREEGLTSGMKNALAAGELIVQGALAREESRGSHWRTDFPQTDDEAQNTEIVVESPGV
jgi:L-aspartate oxidase